jgi:hypothetical protein
MTAMIVVITLRVMIDTHSFANSASEQRLVGRAGAKTIDYSH